MADFTLVAQETLHSHTVDNVTLVQANILSTQEGLHTHTVDNTVLVQANVLATQEVLHAHAGDNITLVQAHILAMQESSHAHTVEALILFNKYLTVLAKYLTGSTVTIKMYDLFDNSLVVDTTMTEILSLGLFKYRHIDFLDVTKEYLCVVSDSITQQSLKVIFKYTEAIGTIEFVSIDEVAIWKNPEASSITVLNSRNANL